ncbi:MAG TPA: BTAD domain-containing putative transcriptional regulator [Gemmatimonadales bacterium]|nr:BTAD domain-containing putative transcriptional regulator [Gemmatimonadales bacterium]
MIRIRTLGGLSASRDDQPSSGAATQPRRLAVLALIARAGDRGITRERLLALLWPDTDEEAGRRALSQALHALRTDLHDDDLFLGVQELRLNLAAATCDVIDFESAMAAHEWDRAAAAYAGPFLQGFRLAGAAEFDRWMEEERTHLSHRYAELLERLARVAGEAGNPAAAVAWWRRRAATDPLNARVTVELMRALAVAGERHAAVQQARIYEALLAEELSLEPDAEVLRYAEELRRAPPVAPPVPAIAITPVAPAPVATPAESDAPVTPAQAPSPIRRSRQAPRRAYLGIAALAIIGIVVTVAMLRSRSGTEPPPLLAVGAIADYRGEGESGPLTDILATNLARIPGLQVVGTARLLELIARAGQSPDAAAYAAAARRAGASDLMEGGLHAAGSGLLLELRRVHLASGSVLGAWRIEGKDLFALVDSATSEVAASLGRGPTLGPGGAGTRSLVAWRFYEEGLHAFARGDFRGAGGLFEAALREDSVFAMAAYYLARSGHGLGMAPDSAQLARLERLAAGASDRERLQILAWVAHAAQSPALDALADTLIVRYPADIEAQYLAGFARMARAEFAAALPYLHRVIAADSAAAGGAGAPCLTCDALQLLVYAYHALDSLPRAEQVVRGWIRLAPGSAQAWAYLASLLDVTGRPEEAIEARRKANPLDSSDDIFPIGVRIRAGDFVAADRAAHALMAEGSDLESAWRGFFMLSLSLHQQARWRELHALLTSRFAMLTPAQRAGERGRFLRMSEALALLQASRPGEAGRILDSLTRLSEPAVPIGIRARDLTMVYALLAEAGLATGDAVLASRAADSASAWAGRAVKAREQGIAMHAQAMALLARHDTIGAMQTFERAIYSPTLGFTRTNYHLARLFLARGEPRKAAAILRPALQGFIGMAAFTDLHELIAEAYDRLGQADSARVHWRWVAGALAHADPEARPRYATAVARGFPTSPSPRVPAGSR